MSKNFLTKSLAQYFNQTTCWTNPPLRRSRKMLVWSIMNQLARKKTTSRGVPLSMKVMGSLMTMIMKMKVASLLSVIRFSKMNSYRMMVPNNNQIATIHAVHNNHSKCRYCPQSSKNCSKKKRNSRTANLSKPELSS